MRLHAKDEHQKAKAQQQQPARFAGEFEKTSCVHLKGL
jgi:environmental stress-induced protein Ves